jgi:glycosyltransferase involved in cell wall biosynthesis
VHTFHGHLLQGYFAPPTTRLVARAESLLASHTDRLIAVGAQVRDDLLAAGIGRPAQYDVVAPGTSLGDLPDRFTARRALGLPQDVPVVAYVGRLTRIKRPDRLITVAREVIQAVPDARFVVCGDGDLAADVAQAATDLSPSLQLLGWRADVETIYAAADVILLTSDNEGMPVSLIEAGLAGLPAVATAVGSVAEVVEDGRTGLLAPCDAGQLARNAIRLLGDEALRHQLGTTAAARCRERFGPERLVSDVQMVYEEVAGQHGWWPGRPRIRDTWPVADSQPTPAGRVRR